MFGGINISKTYKIPFFISDKRNEQIKCIECYHGFQHSSIYMAVMQEQQTFGSPTLNPSEALQGKWHPTGSEKNTPQFDVSPQSLPKIFMCLRYS